jgi:GNAT superfamily N-acetyltransferase
MKLRQMTDVDWSAVADLICVSTNYWYQVNRGFPIFANGPDSVRLFCEVYEALDPGCCLLAEDETTGLLMGSCFYHPRPTHISLGIMNVHPNYFGKGVARALLTFITDLADAEKKPVRLVSSAMNLDSFSLYTKAGFVPRQAFQDMMIAVPKGGLDFGVEGSERVRDARLDDVLAIVDLEKTVSGIDRTKDFEYFIKNEAGIWHTSVYEGVDGQVDGVLVSVKHPGSNMLGPGVMRSEVAVLPLIWAELNANKGCSPVFLMPVDSPVVQDLYAWGARNCEVHFAQIRGHFQAFDGVVMPTFMPETG